MSSRTLAKFCLATSLFLVACALDPITYNNKIVTHMKAISSEWESTAESYYTDVPNDLSVTSTVDVFTMDYTYNNLKLLVEEIETDLLTLESSDEAQQAAVRPALEDFVAAGESYLEVYSEMVDYYRGDFASDLDRAYEIDEKLYAADNTWVEAYNNLATVLQEN